MDDLPRDEMTQDLSDALENSDELKRLAQRLRLVIGDNSVRSFSRACGLSERAVRKYLAGGTDPSRGALVAMARAGEVHVDWLATGHGGMRIGGDACDTGGGCAAIPWLFAHLTVNDKVASPLRAVNFLCFKQEWLKNTLHIDMAELCLLCIEDEGMTPTLRPGDVVLVDRREQTQVRDGLYLLRMDETMVVKRLQRLPDGVIEVSSDNPAYRPFQVNTTQMDNARFAIIGRVIWSGCHS